MTHEQRASEDRIAVQAVIDRFFAGFTSGTRAEAGAADLREVLLPGAVLVQTAGEEPVVYDVDGFIGPRLALLTSGTLSDFREAATSGQTVLFGDIAQHWCSYEKMWRQDGADHAGAGAKGFQLVRTAAGWRISALVWEDERPGLSLPPRD